MSQELPHYVPEKLPHAFGEITSFQIHDWESREEWEKGIWPNVKTLLQTTWPAALTPGYEDYLAGLLSKKDSSILLMKSSLGEIIGTSLLYSVADYGQSHRKISYPKDGKVAYNSTLIVDPRYRSQGLMIPLVEQTLQEASLLGYDYVVGHYNRATGIMRDGRMVQTGFASRIKEHDWQNGTVIFPTIPVEFKKSDGIELSENIVFKLPMRQSVDQVRPLRRTPFAAVA